MYLICKELQTGERKLLQDKDLLDVDWRKMRYSAMPPNMNFKRRVDYGRLKQADGEQYVYRYWVVKAFGK